MKKKNKIYNRDLNSQTMYDGFLYYNAKAMHKSEVTLRMLLTTKYIIFYCDYFGTIVHRTSTRCLSLGHY